MSRRFIPVPRGMCPAFYKFMAAGCHRNERGEIMMLAPEEDERDDDKASVPASPPQESAGERSEG